MAQAQQSQEKSPVLVTGCAGFIGARTCELLLEQGTCVVGIDNLNDYYDVSLKQHRLTKLQKNESFEFYQLDVEDANSLNGIFAKFRFETVINFAARAGVRYSLVNPTVYLTTNAIGTLNLLESMRGYGGKKFVLASTSSLYAGLPTPFLETLPVNTPISPYAASKKAAESIAYSYHHLYGIDCSILRYFTVFGPADRPDMAIHRFIQWIDCDRPIAVFGDGKQTRDFTFVDDIARATIASMKPLGFEVINLGGGNAPIELNSVIDLIAETMGKQATVQRHSSHKGDMTTTWADIGKAKRLLGWSPQVSLVEGISRCVEWYIANLPWSASIDLGVDKQ